jgi:hypothetical protein
MFPVLISVTGIIAAGGLGNFKNPLIGYQPRDLPVYSS